MGSKPLLPSEQGISATLDVGPWILSGFASDS